MSYDLYVCIPPLPPSDQDAWKLFESLRSERGEKPQVFKELITRLAARFPWELPVDSDKHVWSISPLWDCIGTRVTGLCMIYPKVVEVVPFVIETAMDLGLDVFEPQLTWIFRHDGLKGLVLSAEDKPPLMAPTLPQILEAVDSLKPIGGPGYLVLQDERDDYAQSAGGYGVFTAEWREYEGKSFRHWVAGNPGQPSTNDVLIEAYQRDITVKENERLTAAQVKEILAAYAMREKRPSGFAWRDMTEMFR